MFGTKPNELLIILLVILLLFGARKLPELARSIGSSAKEFRKGLDEGASDDKPETHKPEQHEEQIAPTVRTETGSATTDPTVRDK